ncbi:MAG: hypothetical protein U1C55_00360 [Smithellaceae bacterium]|nr:hypothetical protein [Smithellaceae bacterium]
MNGKFRLKSSMYFMVFIACLGMEGIALSASQSKAEDLSTHPVYSGYNFGKDEKVIDFGTQPLASTMGVITELMKRDGILRGELKGRGSEIRFHPFYKGADINFFVRNGEIEVATLGDAPAIAIASSYDAILVALVKQGYSSLIARERMLINELKGRKVGYTAGSTAHYIPLRDFERKGFVFQTFELLKAREVVPPSASWERLRENLNRSIMADVLSNTVKYRLDKFYYDTGKETK